MNYKQLIKLANRIKIDDILYNISSKQSAKNYIRKYVEPLTKGIFRDDDWSNVHKVFDKMRELGLDVEVDVIDGGYHENEYGNIVSKEYQWKTEFENKDGKIFKLSGSLTCGFCGSSEKPYDEYDMVFQIY